MHTYLPVCIFESLHTCILCRYTYIIISCMHATLSRFWCTNNRFSETLRSNAEMLRPSTDPQQIYIYIHIYIYISIRWYMAARMSASHFFSSVWTYWRKDGWTDSPTDLCHLNSAPFLYLHHRHCQSQDIIFIRLLYPSPLGPSTQHWMSSLPTLLPWPIWSFTLSIWTTPPLTATLFPPGILEIGPELLLTPLWRIPLWFVAALVNKLVPWCSWLLSSALEILRLRLRLYDSRIIGQCVGTRKNTRTANNFTSYDGQINYSNVIISSS